MKKLLLFISILIYIIPYFRVGFPVGQPVMTYSTVPDADADFLISKKVSEGKGLYTSFSILYPPGRFFVQGALFKLISPSFAVTNIFHAAVDLVFYPALLFVLSYYIFEHLLLHFFTSRIKYSTKIILVLSYFLALLTSFIHLTFIRSAQEAHIISGLFFLLLLTSKKLTAVKVFFLGVLFGLTFLFRTDTGILLLISVIASLNGSFLRKIRNQYIKLYPFIFGVSTVWIPTILLIILNGSLFNFLYDILILGLLIQPKFMSLPIPPNELGLVFLSTLIFLIASALTLVVDAQKMISGNVGRGLIVFATFSVLSYVSALGRSDEPHLWYGLVWLAFYILYSGVRVFLAFFRREKFSFGTFALGILFFFSYSWLVLYLKSPAFFLLTFPLIVLVFKRIQFSAISVLLSGTLTAVLVFHSVSYLTLRYVPFQLPRVDGYQYKDIVSEDSEIGGMKMDEKSEIFLDKIRADIPESEKYLFIFPKNLMIHEYLHLDNPTRYIILANERSEYTEQEIINDLNKTNTQYFLIFPESAELREGTVWSWILENTTTVQEYQAFPEHAELRKRIK